MVINQIWFNNILKSSGIFDTYNVWWYFDKTLHLPNAYVVVGADVPGGGKKDKS